MQSLNRYITESSDDGYITGVDALTMITKKHWATWKFFSDLHSAADVKRELKKHYGSAADFAKTTIEYDSEAFEGLGTFNLFITTVPIESHTPYIEGVNTANGKNEKIYFYLISK